MAKLGECARCRYRLWVGAFGQPVLWQNLSVQSQSMPLNVANFISVLLLGELMPGREQAQAVQLFSRFSQPGWPRACFAHAVLSTPVSAILCTPVPTYMQASKTGCPSMSVAAVGLQVLTTLALVGTLASAD